MNTGTEPQTLRPPAKAAATALLRSMKRRSASAWRCRGLAVRKRRPRRRPAGQRHRHRRAHEGPFRLAGVVRHRAVSRPTILPTRRFGDHPFGEPPAIRCRRRPRQGVLCRSTTGVLANILWTLDAKVRKLLHSGSSASSTSSNPRLRRMVPHDIACRSTLRSASTSVECERSRTPQDRAPCSPSCSTRSIFRTGYGPATAQMAPQCRPRRLALFRSNIADVSKGARLKTRRPRMADLTTCATPRTRQRSA